MVLELFYCKNADCGSACPFLSKYKVKGGFLLNGCLDCCSVNIQLFSLSQLCRVFIPSDKSSICCKMVGTAERKHAFQVDKCCCQPVQGETKLKVALVLSPLPQITVTL